MPNIPVHRSVVRARNGLIAAAHPLATSAGLEVLLGGGTCVDAALAASAVLNVTLPMLSHLGGDLFVLHYSAADGKVTALNGSGAAPAAANVGQFPQGIPTRGLTAATVPGQIHGWFAAHAKWGKKPIASLLARGIEYAKEGFPVSAGLSAVLSGSAGWMSHFPSTADQFLAKGRPSAPGEALRQPNLAKTLEILAADGPDALYKDGDLGRRFVKFVADNGGLMTAKDLAAHTTRFLEPVSGLYRGLTVFEQPPPSQGFIVPLALQLLEGFDLRAAGFGSADAVHLQAEALRAAFADKNRHLGEPEGGSDVDASVKTMLSPAYTLRRRKGINPKKAGEWAAGDLSKAGDTTYFCCVDKNGDAVSWIQSVFHGWGCGVVAGDTGILLNNRMNGFTLEPNHVNTLAGGKRPVHTLNTYIACKDGKLRIVGGTPGGNFQVQTNVQVLSNIIDFGMNPQQAAEAPRFLLGSAVDGSGAHNLMLEGRFDKETMEELIHRGHEARLGGPWAASGTVQVITVDPATGTCAAGSDPRGEGHAAGF